MAEMLRGMEAERQAVRGPRPPSVCGRPERAGQSGAAERSQRLAGRPAVEQRAEGAEGASPWRAWGSTSIEMDSALSVRRVPCRAVRRSSSKSPRAASPAGVRLSKTSRV